MVTTSGSAELLQALELRLCLSKVGGECIIALDSADTAVCKNNVNNLGSSTSWQYVLIRQLESTRDVVRECPPKPAGVNPSSKPSWPL